MFLEEVKLNFCSLQSGCVCDSSVTNTLHCKWCCMASEDILSFPSPFPFSFSSFRRRLGHNVVFTSFSWITYSLLRPLAALRLPFWRRSKVAYGETICRSLETIIKRKKKVSALNCSHTLLFQLQSLSDSSLKTDLESKPSSCGLFECLILRHKV